MRISSVGTVWFREPLVWRRVELLAVPRTTAGSRRIFEVLPTSPAHLQPSQREASTYASIADAQPARTPLVDDYF